jgi:predicted dehydrogenase
MRDPLNVAVVGSGIGASHIRGFQEIPNLFEVNVLCDINVERAKPLAAKYGIQEVVGSFHEVCRRPDVDIIDICTPPNLHLEQIKGALESGKHVICEKPLVGSLAALDSVSRLANKSGCRVMPIFQYRFGHGLQKLKYLVDRKLTGEAFVFNVDVAWWRSNEYYRNNPWRGKRATELGGALLSQAIHAVDMVRYILGPVKSVFGRASTRVNRIEVEDCVAISIEMADGSLGTMSVTLGSAAEISRHRFTFRKVSAESSTEPYANSREPWTFSFSDEHERTSITEALSQFKPLPEGYAGQCYRFHRALRDRTELPVTLMDARGTLEVIAATYYSSQTGEPVILPIGPGHPKYETL